MSSEDGEAEDGHTHHTSTYEDGDPTKFAKSDRQYGAGDHIELSQEPTVGHSDNEQERNEDEKNLSTSIEEIQDRGRYTTGEEAQGSQNTVGRPSSADGSLSIADDTPSVQVRRNIIVQIGCFLTA